MTLPSISIIVPNFNGGATIRRTLQSLIDQNYPNLEILVADGRSTDNSVEVIRQFESHIGWWVSEKDSGQSDAINKGFAHATGQIVNWLCSDDYLLPGALLKVGQFFHDHPATDVLSGRLYIEYTDDGRRELSPAINDAHVQLMPVVNAIPQQSTFYHAALIHNHDTRHTLVREDLHLVMDFELWNFLVSQNANWQFLPDVLAVFVMGQDNKTATLHPRVNLEQESVYREYCHERISLAWWYRAFMLPVQRWRGRQPRGIKKVIGLAYKLAFVALLGPFYGFNRVKWMNLGTLE